MARYLPFPHAGFRRDRRDRILASRSVREGLMSVAGLIGRRVRLGSGADVGRLWDLVARWEGESYPTVTGLVLRVGRRRAFVPASHVAEMHHGGVVLGSARLDLRDFERRPSEVLLAGDVLDHQLVDCDGVQVVRASDLYLAPVAGQWRLVGVDVGFQSLLRRLGPARWRARPTPARVIDWGAIQPFGIGETAMRLRRENQSLRRLRPADLADLLEELGRSERQELLGALEPESAADALEEMEPGPLRALLHDLPDTQAAALVAAMEPDEAVDALRDLDDNDRQRLLSAMTPALASKLRLLLLYPEHTAGGLMTTRMVFANTDETVMTVRRRLASEAEDGQVDVDAVVVLDDDRNFVDDISMLDLFLSSDETTIANLVAVSEPVCVLDTAPLDAVIDELIDSRRASLIVVDENNRPQGRILADDVIDALVPDRGRHGVRVHLP
jgi:CBS domain-containing protein